MLHRGCVAPWHVTCSCFSAVQSVQLSAQQSFFVLGLPPLGEVRRQFSGHPSWLLCGLVFCLQYCLLRYTHITVTVLVQKNSDQGLASLFLCPLHRLLEVEPFLINGFLMFSLFLIGARSFCHLLLLPYFFPPLVYSLLLLNVRWALFLYGSSFEHMTHQTCTSR